MQCCVCACVRVCVCVCVHMCVCVCVFVDSYLVITVIFLKENMGLNIIMLYTVYSIIVV